MRKILLTIGILLILPFFLMACGNTGIDLDDIDIDTFDQIGITPGSYEIYYTIDDLQTLIEKHGAVVSFVVTNSRQETVDVTQGSFTVVANEVYTVVLRLTIGDSYKEKTFTVTATALSSFVLVTFELNGGLGSFPVISVDRNSVLTMTDSPTKDGFIFAGWYVDESLSTPYTNQEITDHITLYAKWSAIVISTATVTFDLQGGSGSFSDQVVNMGTYATRPSVEPTKEGFTFLGWYVEASGNQPFDFETMTIYENTTVYAKWEEVSTASYTVTYDLNGAFQPEPIIEHVNENSYPTGPTTEFVYTNHIFIGWSLDSNALFSTPLDELSITADATLYAVWHIDFDEIEGTSYIENQTFIQSSTLNNGFVEQRITLSALMHLAGVETDFSVSEDRVEYGILYSIVEDTPSYYSANTMRVVSSFDDTNQNTSTIVLNVLTEPLLSDTNYTFVIFARYETKIIYSPVYTYKTYIQVPEGTVVGANYVLSGGYFKFDTENVNFKPSMIIEILDGYTATVDGVSYASWSDLYREGIRQLVTKDTLTGDEYLHVFNLDLQTPHVSLVYTSLIENDTSFIPQYRITFPFDEDLNYPISEMGVLYSTEHPFLKLEIPGVSKKSGTLDQDDMYMITQSAISTSDNPVYIRAYAIINGKVSYARYITKLEMNSEDVYEVVESIDTSEEKLSPENGTSFSISSSTIRVYKVDGSTLTYVDYSQSFDLKDEGQYFLRNADGTGMIQDYLIIDDFPDVVGVEELGQYVDSVFVTYDTYNPYWYYAINDGEYIYLPAQVRFSVPGYYELYYRTAEGMEVIHFEIVTQVGE